MNPSETIIVIRSLVPGGVAQQDGRLIPGDRLLFVNDINLENASLDEAVQVLKGAPRGLVQIGVAKPHPVSLNESASNGASEMQASSPTPKPLITEPLWEPFVANSGRQSPRFVGIVVWRSTTRFVVYYNSKAVDDLFLVGSRARVR